MADKKKPEFKIIPQKRVVTPAATSRHVYLNKPDHGKDDWYDEVGNYKASLIMTPEEAQPIIDVFKELLDAQVAEVKPNLKGKALQALEIRALYEKGCPIQYEYDDDEELTGNLVIAFKSRASYTNKNKEKVSNKPTIIDCTSKAQGGPNRITDIVCAGSKLQIATMMKPYYYAGAIGVKFQIDMVRVVELVTLGGKADNFDVFDDFEGGFTAAPNGSLQEEPEESYEVEEKEDF